MGRSGGRRNSFFGFLNFSPWVLEEDDSHSPTAVVGIQTQEQWARWRSFWRSSFVQRGNVSVGGFRIMPALQCRFHEGDNVLLAETIRTDVDRVKQSAEDDFWE